MKDVRTYFGGSQWNSEVAGNPWDARTADRLSTIVTHAPYDAHDGALGPDEASPPVRFVFELKTCLVGKHGLQYLEAVHLEPSPAWNETEVEWLLTSSSSPNFTALHQIHYGVDGDVWASSVQLSSAAGMWLKERLNQMAHGGRIAALAAVRDE